MSCQYCRPTRQILLTTFASLPFLALQAWAAPHSNFARSSGNESGGSRIIVRSSIPDLHGTLLSCRYSHPRLLSLRPSFSFLLFRWPSTGKQFCRDSAAPSYTLRWHRARQPRRQFATSPLRNSPGQLRQIRRRRLPLHAGSDELGAPGAPLVKFRRAHSRYI